jgi:hypothetical protein
MYAELTLNLLLVLFILLRTHPECHVNLCLAVLFGHQLDEHSWSKVLQLYLNDSIHLVRI